MAQAFTLAQFKAWGKKGGETRASKYTKRQISNMARRGHKKRKNGNGPT